MLLDKALEFAVILSWSDLLTIVAPVSVRIEYRRESNKLLDQVTIWADKGKGYRDRVCDYATADREDLPAGMRFWRGHDSEQLAQALGFIMQNQVHFTFPAGARESLLMVLPPGDEERAEAALCRAEISGTNTAHSPVERATRH